MGVPELVLDPSLKYWALLPISLAMVLFGLIRQQLNGILSPSVKLPVLDDKYKHAQILRKVSLFKANNWNLTDESFTSRKGYLIEILSNGSLLPKEETKVADEQPQIDTAATDTMMNLMKNQFGTMAAQYVMMGWVNYFYAGFILMKLPFPLTHKFKQMLQSGVSTADLDVRWVSSISWYFIAILGMNSVYNILIGDGQVTNQLVQQQQTPPPMPGFGAQDNQRKQMEDQLIRESNDLKITAGKSVFDGIDQRLLNLYG